MREIKYQAWLNKQQRMIDVETIKFIDIGGKTHAEVTAKVDHEKGGWYTEIRESTHRKTVVPGSHRQVPRVILRQYTGLKDKNDTEIYEGDELKIKFSGLSGRGYVYWCNVMGQWWIKDTRKNVSERNKGRTYPLYQTASYEVISNIYENPELLEVD